MRQHTLEYLRRQNRADSIFRQNVEDKRISYLDYTERDRVRERYYFRRSEENSLTYNPHVIAHRSPDLSSLMQRSHEYLNRHTTKLIPTQHPLRSSPRYDSPSLLGHCGYEQPPATPSPEPTQTSVPTSTP